jgi:dynein heavy chain
LASCFTASTSQPTLQPKKNKQQKHSGLEDLQWRAAPEVDAFLREASDLVRDLDGALTTLKDNVKRTGDALRVFERALMFERKEGKVYAPDELADAAAALMAQRHAEVRDAGKEVAKLLSASNRAVKASKTAAAWRDYVSYVNGVVVDGFVAAIAASTNHLLAQMDYAAIAAGAAPLMEIQLELAGREVVWKPELGSSGGAFV